MNARTASLRRIGRLYGLVEEMHSVVLREASGMVRKVEVALRVEREMAIAVADDGRLALGEGEREEWLLAQAGGEIFAMRTMRLQGLKDARVAAELAARTEFLASRTRAEQIKQVEAQRIERMAVEEGRRTQAASDDRYAARRAWSTGRRDRETEQLRSS